MTDRLKIIVNTSKFLVSVIPPVAYSRTLVLDPSGKNVRVAVDNVVAKVDALSERIVSVVDKTTTITLKYYLLSGGGGGGPSPSYTNRFDEIDINSFYFGEATPGSDEDSAVWRIRKVIDRLSDMKTLWAEGSSSFSYKWTERESLTYN